MHTATHPDFPRSIAPKSKCSCVSILKIGRVIAACWLLTNLIVPAATQADDDLEMQLAKTYAPALRWDNVEQEPLWVQGIKPVYDSNSQRHLVTLQPGTETTVRLPPRAMLRVVPQTEIQNGPPIADGNSTAIERLAVFISNGSGLWMQRLATKVVTDKSLLFAPDQSSTMLARVRLPGSVQRPLTVSLFVSRYESAEPVAPHRKSVRFTGESVMVQRDDQSKGEEFAAVSPTKHAEWQVEGPRRIEVRTRFQYPLSESRQNQWYRIHVNVDGQRLRDLDFETSPESNTILIHKRKNVRAVLSAGQQQTASFVVPSGTHTVRLTGTGDVLVQMLELNESDYLLSGNAPITQAGFSTRQEWTPPTLWDISEEQISTLPLLESATPAQMQRIALRSARDNRFPNGATQAMLLMRESSARQPGVAAARQRADALRGRHTYYKTLIDHRCQQAPRFGWFSTRSLRHSESDPKLHSLYESHVDDAVKRLNSGLFFPAGTQSNPGEFSLPLNRGDSMLRLAVELPDDGALRVLKVQFDDRPPFVVLADRRPRPDEEFTISKTEFALAALARRETATDAGTLGGPFSRGREPAPLLKIATTETLIPATVNNVRVWVNNQPMVTAVPNVCLQIRNSSTYQLSETEFIEMWGRVFSSGMPPALITSLLADPREQPIPPTNCPDVAAWHELRNHYVPLARRLRNAAIVYRAGTVRMSDETSPARLSRTADHSAQQVVVGTSPNNQIRLSAHASDVSKGTANQRLANVPRAAVQQLARARQLMKNEKWLLALEAWNRVPIRDLPEHETEMRFARITALQKLGETFLATQQLRSISLFANSDKARQRATAELLRQAKQDNNATLLQAITATQLFDQPAPEPLLLLGRQFADTGRFREALLCGMLLPPGRQRDELLIESSFHQKWWQMFDSVAMRLSLEKQHYWKGQRALSQGLFGIALKEFASAGEPGLAWTQTVRNALRTTKDLRNQSASDYELLARWCSEFSDIPGKRVWKQQHSLVTHCAGTRAVHLESSRTVETASLATEKQPVRLRVIGPARLKLEFRPVHPHEHSAELNGWVNVKVDSVHHPISVVGNSINDGSRFQNESVERPGQKIERVFEVNDPGWHTIEIHGDAKFAVLTRALLALPAINPGILPTPSAPTVAAIETGHFANSQVLAATPGSEAPGLTVQTPRPKLFVVKVNGRLAQIPQLQKTELPSEVLFAHRGTNPAAAAKPNAPGIRAVSHTSETVDQPQIVQVNFNPDSATLDNTGVKAAVETTALKATAISATTNTTASVDSVIRQMEQLIWLSEVRPARLAECRATGFELAQQFPNSSDVQKLRKRLMAGTRWARVALVRSSAGLRTQSIQGWTPETPALRIRKSLLPPDEDYDIVLNGKRRFVARFTAAKNARLNVVARLHHPDGAAPAPAVVTLQIDNGDLEAKTLIPNENGIVEFTQDIFPGEHVFKIGLTETVANQFVCVNADVTPTDLSSNGVGKTDAIHYEFNRTFHVATRKEPLTLRLPGPNIVRIDEHSPHGPLTRYVVLKEPKNEFEVVPTSDADEVLFRVFKLTNDPFYKQNEPVAAPNFKKTPPAGSLGTPGVSSAIPLIPASLLPTNRVLNGNLNNPSYHQLASLNAHQRDLSALLLTPVDEIPPFALINDHQPLRDQEDSTYSASLAHFERRALEESLNGRRPDRFEQVAWARRKYDPNNRNYWKNELVYRNRNHAGDSFGMRNQIRHQSRRWPIQVGWSGSAFVQQPGGPLPGFSGETEWATYGRASVSQSQKLHPQVGNTWTASMFGRLLSLDRGEYLSGNTDQDIFTSYKSDHRFGVRLTDSLSYRPWMDTRLWAQGTLASNQNFHTLDFLSVRGGMDQLLGPVELTGAYRVLRFLNDQDRNRASTSQLLYLDATLESWPYVARNVTPTRSELGVSLQHEPLDSETSVQVFWTMFLDNGRLYRDFRAGERPFRNIQRRRALLRPDNELFVSDGPLSTLAPPAHRFLANCA